MQRRAEFGVLAEACRLQCCNAAASSSLLSAHTLLSIAERTARRNGSSDNEDSNSYASSITAYSNNGGEQELLHSEAEAFAACIDDTYESRGSTREAAWERLGAMMRASVRADDCCQKWVGLVAVWRPSIPPVGCGFKLLTFFVSLLVCSASTVVSRAQNSMRKGSAVEAAAAATTLGECMTPAAGRHCNTRTAAACTGVATSRTAPACLQHGLACSGSLGVALCCRLHRGALPYSTRLLT